LSEKENNSGISNVVLVGAGNVAWHLGHHLLGAGFSIIQVLNRSREPGTLLAKELKAAYCSDADSMTQEADLYILAISDDALGEVLDSGRFRLKGLVVHTSGSISMNVFEGRSSNYGVLYPLQTFTRGKAVSFKKLPLFIEANHSENLAKLEFVASKLSDAVHCADSATRLQLHLAGVIASNFSNHLFLIADELLSEKGLSFDMLKPLIRETLSKAMIMPPRDAQTGPAIRGNIAIIEKHLEMLLPHPKIREIYRLISERILASGSK
jgi:predicted short-subunit dehydrogenase-like oxidoreductase (DUF2520 family)